MTAKILKQNGQYSHCSTYRPLTQDEVMSPGEIKLREQFDVDIEAKLGLSSKEIDFVKDLVDTDTPHMPRYEDDETKGNDNTTPDRDSLKDDHFDQYLNAAVLLPSGDQMLTGKVTKRKKNSDGVPTGIANSNPILDTREYVVEFPDGSEKEYSANKIAEAMYTQCDLEGNQYLLLDSIVDFKMSNDVVQMANRYTITKGRNHLRKTTKGCHWYFHLGTCS